MPRFEDVARDVDMVFDTQGGETQARSWATLKRGGILVSIAQPPDPAEAEKHGVRATFAVNEMKADSLSAITRLVDTGKLKAVVDTVFPLAEARRGRVLGLPDARVMSAQMLGKEMLVEHRAQQQPTELLAVPLR
jgi:NADPH:quinone reductase-like Zn-dependent oxidoreductase